MKDLWRRLADRLLGPHPRIKGTDERAAARLFASLTLAQVLVVLLAFAALAPIWQRSFGYSVLCHRDSHVVLAGNALTLVVYALLRMGAYRAGVLLWVALAAGVSLVAPFVSVHPGRGTALLAAAVLPVLFTAIAFSEGWAATVLVAVLLLASVQIMLHRYESDVIRTELLLTGVVAVTGVLTVILRRHQRRQEERHLAGARESEAAYRGLFESMTDTVLIVESGGRILEANQTACAQFGYPYEEMLTKSVYELTELTKEAGEKLREAGRMGRKVGVEITARRRNGERVPVELALAPILFRGRPAIVSAGRDLTERNRFLQQRLQLEAKLRESAKLESIGLLAGGVAHDFNNLLTAIIGNLALADEEGLPEHVREALVECQRAADSAAALTRQLLAFSRRQVVEPQVIDLNNLLVGLRRMLVRLIGEDVELSTSLAPGLHPVKIDPGVVEQIVVNLAVNARDAMPEGGKLAICTENVTLDEAAAGEHPDLGPGEHVRLTVIDTGSGMTPEVMARLFEPFFTTKPRGRGTGLGLSTTYGLVRQSGGEIRVESERGRGTTFSILLPRAAVAGAGGIAEARSRPVPAPGGNETILLVEDNQAILRLAELTLSSAGYRVLAASSAEQAQELVKARLEEVELMVTDVVLPGMNGRKLSEALRERHPAMRVLFTSGYNDDRILLDGAMEDSAGFLPKPYTPRVLMTRVREVLDAGRSP